MEITELLEEILKISDPQLISQIADISELKKYSKKQILVQEGQPLSHLQFLVSGILRGFFLDIHGRDITDCFGYQPGAVAMSAFALDAPSPITIETLTESVTLAIPMAAVIEMLQKDVRLVYVYNRLLLDGLKTHWEIKSVLHKQTADERYQWFLKEYPGLIDQITNRYIASFLGMSPVTLSRLRSASRNDEKQ